MELLTYLPYLVFLGAAVQLFGTASYIKDTLKGKTKPNKITWLLWAIAPLIATAAAISDGVGLAVLPVFISGFGPLLVFLSSFTSKESYWKLEKFDYICGACSILALILWWLTKEPMIAILFSVISDAFAGIPTLIKAWKYPETENPDAYTYSLFNSLTSFAAISVWNFSSLAFPIYLTAANIALSYAVLRKKFIK